MPTPWNERFRAIISVYLVLQNDQDEVLLLKRQNTGFCDGQYGLPAGHVDGGEELKQAMLREAKEEVDLDLDEHDLELIHVIHRNRGDHERVDFFFRCTNWSGEPKNAEPYKCSELKWYPINELPEETIDYYEQMFKEVLAGKNYSHFGW